MEVVPTKKAFFVLQRLFIKTSMKNSVVKIWVHFFFQMNVFSRKNFLMEKKKKKCFTKKNKKLFNDKFLRLYKNRFLANFFPGF